MVVFPVVRPLAARLLVTCLILALTPGLAEAAENLWHLALAGHGAHALDQGADHAPAGEEHGCSGAFHLCYCHHSLVSDLLAAPLRLRPDPPVSPLLDAASRAPADPPVSPPERPPRS